jgi:sec-independent protein translocase protein TatA
MNHLLFMNLGAGEIIIVALVVLLLFGGKKIPELMHGIGKGVKSFKDGMNDIESDLKSGAKKDNKIDNSDSTK